MIKVGVIPKMHVVVEQVAPDANGSIRYQWSVTMLASDALGKRSLGYRGSGSINKDLTDLQFETGPEVHDENLPRWTPMNPTDRPDIRKQIARLARAAAEKLVKSGQPMFEHLIP